MMREPGGNGLAIGTSTGRGEVGGASDGMGNSCCGAAIRAERSEANDESPAGEGGAGGAIGLPCPIVKADAQ